MEEEKNAPRTQEEPGYVPRPAWQVWGSRIGLVLFILLIVYQIICIATGGRA